MHISREYKDVLKKHLSTFQTDISAYIETYFKAWKTKTVQQQIYMRTVIVIGLIKIAQQQIEKIAHMDLSAAFILRTEMQESLNKCHNLPKKP